MKAWIHGVSFMILAGLLTGCSTTSYTPGLQGPPQMSLAEAYPVIRARTGLQNRGYANLIELKWVGLRFVSVSDEEIVCRFDQTTAIEKESNNSIWVDLSPHRFDRYGTVGVGFDKSAEAKRYADAFYVLKQNYLAKSAPETPQQQAAFEAVVKQYRTAQPPPALPEAAVRYKAQAELAVQQKRFDEAEDLYAKALEIAPWWPQGRYNRGLLLGELEAYNEGIREFQKYLKLEPDASNAKAVQTKIYQWESLATKSPTTR